MTDSLQVAELRFQLYDFHFQDLDSLEKVNDSPQISGLKEETQQALRVPMSLPTVLTATSVP